MENSSAPSVKLYRSSTGAKIFRIPCKAMEHLSAYVFVVLEAGPPTLIDAGGYSPRSRRDILAGLESIQNDFGVPFHFKDIRRILLTHTHEDHIGGLADFFAQTEAEIGVHSLERKVLTSGTEVQAMERRILTHYFAVAGVPSSKQASLLKICHAHGEPLASLPIALELAEGMALDGIAVHHTPGHCPGHVCFGIGDVLICGDHILSQTIPQQWPESLGAYRGLSHYLESLEKIARLTKYGLAIPSHEKTIRDIPGRAASIAAAHVRRLERLLKTLRDAASPLTVNELTEKLYPEVSGFRAFLAVTDVGARVEYLYQRDQLVLAEPFDAGIDPQAALRYSAR